MPPFKLTLSLLLTVFSAYLLSVLLGLIPYLLIDFFPLWPFALGVYVCLLLGALFVLFTDKFPRLKQHFLRINLTILFISLLIAMMIPSNSTIVNRPKVLELKGNLMQVQAYLKTVSEVYPINANALKQQLEQPLNIEDYRAYQEAETYEKYKYQGSVLYQAPTGTRAYQLYGVSPTGELFRWPADLTEANETNSN